jgi:TPR repeat protein
LFCALCAVLMTASVAAAQGSPNSQSGPPTSGPIEDAQAAFKRGDRARAFQIWRPLAENGDPDAQFWIGFAYQNGLGAPRDPAQALSWYRKAADHGNAFAQNWLGAMYRAGRRVTQDYAEALRWYRKAAGQGDADAQSKLGDMYAEGNGVPQDYIQAYTWYSLVASHSTIATLRDYATKDRDDLSAKMTPAQIAEAQRLAAEWDSNHAK